MRTILSIVLLAISLSFSTITWAEMVNINKADAAALMENLPGIGETKAKAIVDFRKKNGQFKSIDDLLEVPGIGEKTFKGLKSEVSTSKGATKATGKKPITSTSQTGSGKKSNDDSGSKSTKSAEKDNKSDDKDNGPADKDTKTKDNKAAKKDGNSQSSSTKPSTSQSAKKAKCKKGDKNCKKSATTKTSSKKKSSSGKTKAKSSAGKAKKSTKKKKPAKKQ